MHSNKLLMPASLLALTAAVALANTAHAALLVADYQFNGNLQSSVSGAPDLVYPGSNMRFATKSATMDLTTTPGAAAFGQSTGFSLDVSGILGTTYARDYSVAMLCKLPDPNNWRGLAYGSPSRVNFDDGIMTYDNRITMWAASDHSVGTKGDIPADTWVQILYTVSSDGANYDLMGMIGTGPSAKAATFTALPPTHYVFALDPNDLRIEFFRDNYQDLTAGSVDRIQIYQGALTDSEARAVNLAVVDAPEPASLSLLALGGLTLLTRRRGSSTRA